MRFERMVGFSHSIFVLPFALSAVVLAGYWLPRSITWSQVIGVIVAAMSGRSAAIGFNRLADLTWDRLNPRTRYWALPRGAITPRQAFFGVVFWAIIFMVAMAMLNPSCLYLSPVILSVAFFHAFTKRFTWTSHFFLGLVYAMAPIGAWVAVAGGLHPSVLVLSIIVAAWGAGFDILYGCLDIAFDREWGLYSIPQTFGITKAVWISRLLHGLALLGMLILRWVFVLNAFYLFGVLLVALFLAWGHTLRPTSIRKTFFNTSGLISVFYFVAVAGGVVPSVFQGLPMPE
jgi:4-hydroxybenzoate polyprenyltransferase